MPRCLIGERNGAAASAVTVTIKKPSRVRRNPQPLALVIGLCNPSGMKNKNQRDLERHWAKEAAKKLKKKPASKAKPEDVNQTAAGIASEAPKH